jgi:glutathione-regulated potassium-efflux system ancillary protein KefC
MMYEILSKFGVLLLATIIAVPLFKRLGLGAVVGYLIAGIILGPEVTRLIPDVETVMHFSEFGVVLLLFLIGMELSVKRLWTMRRSILGVGSLQVGSAVILITGLLYLSGIDFSKSLVFAMGASLSSTAIAMQLLGERGLHQTPAGKQGFSILLFQDLAIIPMLAVLPLLSNSVSPASEGSGWLEFAKIVGALGGIVFAGRYLLRPVFRIVAGTGIREVFTAFSLCIVLGVSLLMHEIGLSMGLGAFLAGVLLAESEYKHAIEVDIEPFKGLLLGIFFMSVGMSLDLTLLLTQPGLILGLTLAVLIVKILLFLGIGKVSALNTKELGLFALILCQVGEFAFVLFNLAFTQEILTQREMGIASAVVAMSMILSPLLLLGLEMANKRSSQGQVKAFDEISGEQRAVLIAGFGRVGQVVGRMLNAHDIPVTVLEHDPTQIDLVRKFGFKVFYGDASRLDLLEQANIKNARLLVVAVENPDAAMKIIHLVKEHFPKIPILARARNRGHAFDLIDLGIEKPVRETFDGALHLSTQALVHCGLTRYSAHRAMLKFRSHDERFLQESAVMRKEGGEKALVAFASQIRSQLSDVMSQDKQHHHDLVADEWG